MRRLTLLIFINLIFSLVYAQNHVEYLRPNTKYQNIESRKGNPDLVKIDSVLIDSVFKQFDRKDCPGCAVAVMNAGNIIFQKGYGMANIEHQVPISSRTVFDIASVTKQFTAFAILLLEKRRKLSLDDDVRKYVPELPDFGERITIRHLIHHTSGLRDYGALLMMTGWERDSPVNVTDFLSIISKQKELNYRPGEKFLYNNTNYALLGLIVERVGGRTYSEFINTEVLQALQMNSAKVRDDPWMIVPGVASKYTLKKEGGYNLNYIWSFTKVLGPFGILATVEDLAKWDANFYHERTGGKGIREGMYSPGMLNSGKSSDHAFGLFVLPYRGLRRYLAEGSGGGSSVIMQFPDQKISIVVLCNRYNINPSELAEKVADVVLKEKFPAIQSTEALISISKKKPPINELKKYEGVYWLSGSIDRVNVTIENGILTAQINNEKKSALAFLADGSFYSSKEELVYRFEKEKGVVLIGRLVPGETPEWETAERKPAVNLNHELYVGEYYSPELDLLWSIHKQDGKLYIKRNGSDDKVLEPMYRDGFHFTHTSHLTSIQYRIDFVPDADGKIKEFRVNWGRLIGVVFSRN